MNEETAKKVLEKIMDNNLHWEPGQVCSRCKKGIIGQCGVLIGAFMVDAVICDNCLAVGNKCAKYKGTCGCNSQTTKI